MLSGNGRHRRPRQAPALIVAAGVTGSAIAIPLLGATGAHAADGTTWDRVAECESGGSWSANDGNGYYGGLQLTQENWEKYGGLAYAATADQASRSQQIAVAEKVLDAKGLTAWPTCGPLSGLSRTSGSIAVDTGVAGDSTKSSDSSGSSDSSDSSGSSSSSDSGTGSSGLTDSSSDASSDATQDSTKSDTSDTTGASGTVDGDSDDSGNSKDSDSATTGTTKSDESDKSGQNGDSSDTSGTEASASGSGSGRHRGGSAGMGAADGATDGRSGDASGRHASRGSDAARDAADGSYVVRTGDSLWSIADSLDLKGGWSELYAANEKALGTDPDLILPGQKLELDDSEAATK